MQLLRAHTVAVTFPFPFLFAVSKERDNNREISPARLRYVVIVGTHETHRALYIPIGIAAPEKINFTLLAIHIFPADRPVCTANDIVSCR